MADFDQLKSWVQRDWWAQADYRTEMAEDFAFTDGHQVEEADRAEMEENNRAVVTFNLVAPIIAAVSGSEINNRTEVRFIPREIGDIKPNEILSAGAEWFRDEANAEDEESQAFEEMLQGGIGWTETLLDFDADDEGAPRVIRIDPLEMCWDSHAHRKGLSESTRFARVRKIPRSEAIDMFPDADEEMIDADWISKEEEGEGASTNNAGDEYRNGEEAGKDTLPDDTVTIVQIQWRSREGFVEYLDPKTQKKAVMPENEWAQLKKAVKDIQVEPPPNRKVKKLVWRQAFLGKELLGESQPCKDRSTFQPITGHWDRKERRFYGILKAMKDPQRFTNKMVAQILHIINVNAKGGVMVEEGAVSDVEQFETSYAASDAVTWIKSGRMSGVVPKPYPAMQQMLMALIDLSKSSIREVSGVSLELMGMREAQQSGVLEYQRRQSSMTTLAFYFDSLRFYRKQQGHVILGFLVDWIAPTGRLVRIVKEDSQQYVPLVVDEEIRKYDVIVDDSPSAPNEKERAWAVVEKLLPIMEQAGMTLDDWADVLEYAPLPSSFAEKIRAKAEAQKNKPQEPPPEVVAEMAKTKSETVENQSQTQLNLAKAQQIQATPIVDPNVVQPRKGE